MEYREAIQLDPKSRLALLEYARFLDRQEQFDRAITLYRHAEKLHRRDPAVQNDLGLCFARHGRNEQAIAAFEKAIELAPGAALYRNNIAMVLVDMGRDDEALRHLLAVNGRAVAEYNMGYLLHKTGKTVQAEQHFRAAAHYNPHMKQAQWWVARVEYERPIPGDRRQGIAGPVGSQSQPAVARMRSPERTAMRTQPAPMRAQAVPMRTQPAPMRSQTVPMRTQPAPVRSQTVPMRAQPAPARGPVVWAQSANSRPSEAAGQTRAEVERIPSLRQPRTVTQPWGTARRGPSTAAERLPSSSPSGIRQLEPLPPVQR